ncbi:hypothetical protein ACERJO_06510 [Halalkalibacter sp. AB-rgal2]|uniref:hypothetical protein n=1 Tax=Halalkalibacter sp. AB-rgal2 TaxID=3242695 RepID=UPI00359E20F8
MSEQVKTELTKKKYGSLCKGLWIGGAVAVGLVLAKKEWRTKIVSECKHATESASEAVRFIRDHREEITTQMKQVSNEISEAIRGISTDLKTMSETVSHIKESSEDVIQATKGVAQEVKKLKE